MRGMAMGKRRRNRQTDMWVAATDLPTTVSHPFYARLNQLLREHDFDDFADARCASFYAETMGRPGLAPGIYFRLLLIGYFEGIDSERGIAWRAADSLALRDFLGVGLNETAPDHSTISAHAAIDRSRNASRDFHVGAALPEHGRIGEGQNDRYRRDDTRSQRGLAQHRPARQRREL
jgi:transposase